METVERWAAAQTGPTVPLQKFSVGLERRILLKSEFACQWELWSLVLYMCFLCFACCVNAVAACKFDLLCCLLPSVDPQCVASGKSRQRLSGKANLSIYLSIQPLLLLPLDHQINPSLHVFKRLASCDGRTSWWRFDIWKIFSVLTHSFSISSVVKSPLPVVVE